jgi:hypothetical protein
MGGYDKTNENEEEFFARRGNLILEVINNNREYEESPLFTYKEWFLKNLSSFSIQENLIIPSFLRISENESFSETDDDSDLTKARVESLKAHNPWEQYRADADKALEIREDIMRKDIETDGDCFVRIIAEDENISTASCR